MKVKVIEIKRYQLKDILIKLDQTLLKLENRTNDSN